jgi:AcrR family transcriptional regulator
MGLREEKKERQRSEIMGAAIALFRERGYDQTRVQDIIERLRVSEGTFFNYFPAKDAILNEFAVDQVEVFAAALKSELSAGVHSVADRVREMMRAIARAWSSDREFMAVVVMRSGLLFRASGALKEKEVRIYGLLVELFRDGQASGEIRKDIDAMQLAEMLLAAFVLTAGNWLIGWWGKPTEDLEPRLIRAIDLFLDGCRTVRITRQPAEKGISSALQRAHRLRKGRRDSRKGD